MVLFSMELDQPDAAFRWAAVIAVLLGTLVVYVFLRRLAFRFIYLLFFRRVEEDRRWKGQEPPSDRPGWLARGAIRHGDQGVFESAGKSMVGLALVLGGLLMLSLLVNFGAFMALLKEDAVAQLDVIKRDDGRVDVYYTALDGRGSNRKFTMDRGFLIDVHGEIVIMQKYLRWMGFDNRYHVTAVRTLTQNGKEVSYRLVDDASRELLEVDRVEDTFPYSLYVDAFNTKAAGKPLQPGNRYLLKVTTESFKMEKAGTARIPEWARDKKKKKNAAEPISGSAPDK